MKKKYLAYVLSTAMLASMMPTTSVYADVTKGASPLTYAAAQTATASTDVTIAAGTGSTSGKVTYSPDSAEYKFNVTLAANSAGNASNVTVKVYKANADKNGKEGTALVSSEPAALTGEDSTGKKVDDVVVDVKGLEVGNYIAYAETDSTDAPKESQNGLAFEIEQADMPALSWSGDFDPSSVEIPYSGDAVDILNLDTAITGVPKGLTGTFAYYKEDGTNKTDVGTDGAADAGQAPKNAGSYQLEGKVEGGKNYKAGTVADKKQFTIGKVAPTSIKIAETDAASTNEVDLATNATAEITLAKGTTDLSQITATVTGVKDETGEKVGTLKWTTDGSAAITGDLTAQKITDGETGLQLHWEFVPATNAPANYKELTTNKGTVIFKVAQEPVVDKITSVDLTGMPAPSLEKTVADSKTITAEIPDVTEKTVEWHKTAKNPAIKDSELGAAYEGSTSEDATNGKFEANSDNQYVAKVTLKTEAKTFEEATKLKDQIKLPEGASLSTDTSAVTLDPTSKTLTLLVVFPELTAGTDITDNGNGTIDGDKIPDSVVDNVSVAAQDQAGTKTATIATSALKALAEQAGDVGVQITAEDVATVTLPKEALVAIKGQSNDQDVKIEIKDTKIGTDDTAKIAKAVKIDVKANNQALVFESPMTVTITEPDGYTADEYYVYSITRSGSDVTVGTRLQAEKAIKMGRTAGDNINVTINKPVEFALFTEEQAKEISQVEITGLDTPVTGAAPDTQVAAGSAEYTVESVAWDPAVTDGKFAAGQAYTAKITLTPASGYKFPDTALESEKVTVDGENATKVENGADGKLVVEKTFAATEALKKLEVQGDAPTTRSAEYGAKLSDLTFENGTVVAVDGKAVVAGNWKWVADVDQNIMPEVDGQTTYKAEYVPTDNPEKYEPLTVDVTPTITAAEVQVTAKNPANVGSEGTTLGTLATKVDVKTKTANLPVNIPADGTLKWYKSDSEPTALTDETLKSELENKKGQNIDLHYQFEATNKNLASSTDKTGKVTFKVLDGTVNTLTLTENTAEAQYGVEPAAELIKGKVDQSSTAKTLQYVSGTTDVADIESDTGVLTIKKPGITVITIRDNDATADKQASPVELTLTVKKAVAEVKLNATKTEIALNDKLDGIFTAEITGKVGSDALTTELVYTDTKTQQVVQAIEVPKTNATYEVTVKVAGTDVDKYDITNTAKATLKVGNGGGSTPTPTPNPQPPVKPDNKPSNGGSSGGGHGGYVSSNKKSPVYVDNTGDSKYGTVEVSDKNAKAGDKVTLTVKPDKGYELDKIIVKDRDGNKIDVKEEREGKYTFTMPKSGKVDIEPVFTKVEEKEEEKKEETKREPIEMNTITSRTFNDVHANDWFKTAVDYVVSEGIMAGVGDRDFAPNQNMTRAMVWQVLAKIDGVNTTGGAKWYSKAMDWGMEHKITDGSNVNGKVTREQIASMLYRYAKDRGMNVSVKGSLDKFPDSKKVSGYASEAMQWAVGAGLINGMDGKLNPQGNATRAQVATMLMNFHQLIVK